MSVHETESLLVAVLLQLIVIISLARIAGSLARHLGQPRAVGEILAGLALGPSLLGYFLPTVSNTIFTVEAAVPMQVLSQIGLMFLMFQIGSDFEFSHLQNKSNTKAVFFITIASVATPLLAGFALAQWSHHFLAPTIDKFLFSGFVGIAFAITAVPILGRILREYGLENHELGVVAISAAAANDVIGWLLLASIAALATSQFSIQMVTFQIAGLAMLGLFMWYAATPFVNRLLNFMPIKNQQVPATVMAIVLGMIFAFGIATQKLGIFTIFGGFLCGLLFHHHKEFVKAWQTQVGQFVLVFFLPIFFTYTGLRTNILGLTTLSDWAWCAGFAAIAIVTKILPVYVASKWSGFNNPSSMILGVLMNTRALMELIVINVGYSLGFIPQNIFTMLVVMAIVTTILTGPLLRVLLPKIHHAFPRNIEA